MDWGGSSTGGPIPTRGTLVPASLLQSHLGEAEYCGGGGRSPVPAGGG